MSRRALIAIACLVPGCKTATGTGAAVSFAATAVSLVGAAATVHVDLFCGGNDFLTSGPCPSNDTAATFAIVAGATALIGLGFVGAHVAMRAHDRELVARAHPAAPLPPLAVPAPLPVLGAVDALAAAKQLASARGFAIDDHTLQSRFEPTARAWVFGWHDTATATRIEVDEGGRASGRQCPLEGDCHTPVATSE